MKIHTLLTTEKSKDRARRLQFLRPIKKGAGVSRLTIETNSANNDGTTILREVEQKVELETTSMIEIEKRSRIPEKSPAMTPHLVNHLHYDGMIDYGNNILIGQASDIPHLDNHTKRYPQELSALTRSLPNQEQPIILE